MAKKRLSLRTLGIIESRWLRGISAVSIAGETGTRLDRVQDAIRELESRKHVDPAPIGIAKEDVPY